MNDFVFQKRFFVVVMVEFFGRLRILVDQESVGANLCQPSVTNCMTRFNESDRSCREGTTQMRVERLLDF